MNKFLYILSNLVTLVLMLLLSIGSSSSQAQAIVYAGADTAICENATLHLPDLNAFISGGVSNGYWITSTDGLFNPGGMSNVRFSLGLDYLPGPTDIVRGWFNLLLVSDDPDGFGPLNQVTDTVRITLRGNVTLACHGTLNVSLNNNCMELVTPQMLLTNPLTPYSQYNIELTTPSGNIIPNNILTKDHVNKTITYSIGHMCSAATCWGTLNVQDKTAPTLLCSNHTINCDQSTSPSALGLPIGTSATSVPSGFQTYIVSNLDPCGDVVLKYSDNVQDLNCLNGIQERIIRRWTATDGNNNTSNCTQVISVNALGLEYITVPPHYNDVVEPSLSCSGSWPKLTNGYPSPAHTGAPTIDGCDNIEYTFTDLPFNLCGNSIKLLRKWTIVDWCTNEVEDYNQIIQIMDFTAPMAKAPDSLTLYTTVYDCHTTRHKLPLFKDLVDCSSIDTLLRLKDTFNVDFSKHLKNIKDTFYVDSLPLGLYVASYILIDECNNKDTFSFKIRVIDDKSPFAICNEFLKVSLTSQGTARLFATAVNDHSTDNCGIDSLAIAKMEDRCGGLVNVFRPFVDFCCLETQSPVMVALRVTDIHGNINTCMAHITVEDKIFPTLSCPSNLTISCDYSFSYDSLDIFGKIATSPTSIMPIIINDRHNNGVAGSDGLVSDNCSVNITFDTTMAISCYSGTLKRVFTAKDLFGNEQKCQQTITIINDNPLRADDIIWPQNIDIIGCDSVQAGTPITGVPTFIGSRCSNPEYSYTDAYFMDTQEACVKIVRSWTVIDWCTFNGNNQSGLFTYAQIIKLDNAIAPSVQETCKDTTVCIINNDCKADPFVLILKATDDCTSEVNLGYNWAIDLDNNGSIDQFGLNKTVQYSLPLGQHLLKVTVTDQCGNTSSCQSNITVKDCKKPTPYCISSLTTVIMPSSKSIAIKAKDYNHASFDNCTPPELLKYSFSQNTQDTSKIFTCDDLEDGISHLFELDMWVTDQAGNFDFCTVEIMIQDNNDVCEDVNGSTRITGFIQTYNGKAVKNTGIRVAGINHSIDLETTTESNGAYSFVEVPSMTDITITPISDDSRYSEEVSTLDLVLLQRHILHISLLPSPYQIIAGDANGSNRLTVSDLVAIRKVILGLNAAFDSNVHSWRFVPSETVFANPMAPWQFDESVFANEITAGDMVQNFIGVKIGDVNGSFGRLKDDNHIYNRAAQKWSIQKHDDQITTLNNVQDSEILGFQMSIAMASFQQVTFDPRFQGYTDFAYVDGLLNIVAYFPHPIKLEKGSPLITINGEFIAISEDRLQAETYDEGGTNLLQFEESQISNQEPNFKVYYHNGTIYYTLPNTSVHYIQITDMGGKSVYSNRISGQGQLPFNGGLSGIFYINIIGPQVKLQEKIIAF